MIVIYKAAERIGADIKISVVLLLSLSDRLLELN